MKNYYHKDLYKTLEVEPTATLNEIKAAYRKLARKYHPDVNKDAISIEKFKAVKEAYEILTDSAEKAMYDQFKGYSATYKQTTQAQAKKAYSETMKEETPPPTRDEEVGEKKKRETNESFSNVFNDILDGLFTSNKASEAPKKETKQRAYKAENGSDITMDIKISYIESINGTNRKINILHTETCPHCLGKKFVNGATCTFCKGKGEVSLHKKINIKIPPYVTQNSKIRIANEGNKGKHGGKNGDLYLIIDIENNPFFKFEGNNVLCEIPITPYEAALGTKIEVPTLEGHISMKIPPLTSSGQKFRLPKEGLTDKKTSSIGDQIVTIKIELPKALSLEEITLYEQLRLLSKKDVRKSIKNEFGAKK